VSDAGVESHGPSRLRTRAAPRVTCNGGRPLVARRDIEAPVHPNVTRNGGRAAPPQLEHLAKQDDLGSVRSRRRPPANSRLSRPKSPGCLRSALRAAPAYTDAMFNLALLLQRNNKHAEAAEYWRHYLANDAQSEWAARARRSLKRNAGPYFELLNFSRCPVL